MPFKQFIERQKIFYNSWVYSNYSEDLSIFSAILNFGDHIVIKYDIFLNYGFSSIGIPLAQAIEHNIMFDSFWVIAIFLNILYFFGHFELLPPYWKTIFTLFKPSIQASYHTIKQAIAN